MPYAIRFQAGALPEFVQEPSVGILVSDDRRVVRMRIDLKGNLDTYVQQADGALRQKFGKNIEYPQNENGPIWTWPYSDYLIMYSKSPQFPSIFLYTEAQWSKEATELRKQQEAEKAKL